MSSFDPQRHSSLGPLAPRRRPRLALLAILAGASAMCLAMIAARVWFVGTWDYGFLVWNLLLAWMPLVFAIVASAAATSRRRLSWLVLTLSALVWLLFFPNAPYIVTDFQHIAAMGSGVPTWYDVMVVVWFAWTGLLLGVVSLYLMQRLVEAALGRRVGWWFVLGVTALASVGIYIGRFLRWNSWQVLSDPKLMTDPIWERLRDPAGNERLVAFTLLYGLFFLFVYGSVRLFAALVREDERVIDEESVAGEHPLADESRAAGDRPPADEPRDAGSVTPSQGGA